jgi:Pyruvate/2-oxoglutarate dehydrogenase complex, dehydrogenase (E1) component, eukaryotic type, beta subunit
MRRAMAEDKSVLVMGEEVGPVGWCLPDHGGSDVGVWPGESV